MQHTTKYQFNLIETSDAFGPEALNENTQAVEDKLSALETAHTADKAALEAKADAAQSAADAAQSAANTAQSTADTARAEAAVLPYKVGTYLGNKGDMTIEVGFKPSFLIIGGNLTINNSNGTASDLAQYTVITHGAFAGLVGLTDTGFVVHYKSGTYPAVNASLNYSYIAFR